MHTPSKELLRALRAAVDTRFGTSGSQVREISTTLRSHSRRQLQHQFRSDIALLRTSALTIFPSSYHQPPFSSSSRDCKPYQPSAPSQTAAASSSRVRGRNPYAPTHTDRGPKSKEDTQTDFGAMDVLGHVPAPATSIDACTADGFHLDNGIKTDGGRGLVVVGGEAFVWMPWATTVTQSARVTSPGKISDLLDVRRGIISFPRDSFAILDLLHPKPDLLIIGTGARLWMLGAETKNYISEVLGCRVDIMDTGNATAAYNLLAKERGVEGGAGVGGLFLPIGWRGPN